jgi:5-methylcytosine-specific restriction enzyme A
MTRREFPQSVKVAVVKRATIGEMIVCEECNTPTKKYQIDHVVADSHSGEPILSNAELICETCYSVKNPKDTTIAAKLKRIQAKHLGLKNKTKGTFLRAHKTKPPMTKVVPRRDMYENKKAPSEDEA